LFSSLLAQLERNIVTNAIAKIEIKIFIRNRIL